MPNVPICAWPGVTVVSGYAGLLLKLLVVEVEFEAVREHVSLLTL